MTHERVPPPGASIRRGLLQPYGVARGGPLAGLAEIAGPTERLRNMQAADPFKLGIA
jgi:hypothetical protein